MSLAGCNFLLRINCRHDHGFLEPKLVVLSTPTSNQSGFLRVLLMDLSQIFDAQVS